MPGRLLQRLKVGRDRVAHQAIHEGAQIHHTCRKIPEVSQVVEAAAQNMTRTMQWSLPCIFFLGKQSQEMASLNWHKSGWNHLNDVCNPERRRAASIPLSWYTALPPLPVYPPCQMLFHQVEMFAKPSSMARPAMKSSHFVPIIQKMIYLTPDSWIPVLVGNCLSLMAGTLEIVGICPTCILSIQVPKSSSCAVGVIPQALQACLEVMSSGPRWLKVSQGDSGHPGFIGQLPSPFRLPSPNRTVHKWGPQMNTDVILKQCFCLVAFGGKD